MIHTLKKRLYFVIATYFRFWARFVLWRWRPRVVVITGSSGKTTVLHMVEAQIGDKAVYSHHANSAIGIPFDILGLKPNVSSILKWPIYIVLAPFSIFHRLPKTKLYVAEADCDRPGEGSFLANLLKPEVTIWVSVYRTHSMNFDQLVNSGQFITHEDAIAYEFGFFAQGTSKLVIANNDQPRLVEQLKRVPEGTKISYVSEEKVSSYSLQKSETIFSFQGVHVSLPGFHPRALGNSVQMVSELLEYLDLPLDDHYTKLHMPPGRSSVFQGKKSTTIIDSTYNTGLGAMEQIIKLFDDYPAEHKWLVLGDILEQGSVEAEEHQKLARVISGVAVERIVLLGPRVKKYTYPILRELATEVVCFVGPDEVLDYLENHLAGGETLLFKGARGLEGVIEELLENPADESKLVRREPAWVKRRQAWGLPK